MTPCSRRPSIRSCTSRAATGSRPDVGSSRNSTSGSLSRARARATRWRSPFDSVPLASRARSVRLTARSARSIRSRGSATSYRSAKHSRFSNTLRCRYRPGVSGMIEILRRISGPFAGVERIASHRRCARRRCDQAAQRPHGRRLAGAVRPEKPEHLATADLERDVVEGDPIAESLREALDRERRTGARAGSGLLRSALAHVGASVSPFRLTGPPMMDRRSDGAASFPVGQRPCVHSGRDPPPSVDGGDRWRATAAVALGFGRHAAAGRGLSTITVTAVL